MITVDDFVIIDNGFWIIIASGTSNSLIGGFLSFFINIWFAIRRLNTYILYGKGFLKARRPPKEWSEMKCIKEKMTWNTQDTNLSWYVPKADMDHTISGQGTAVSTLDHSATTPRAKFSRIFSKRVNQSIPAILTSGVQTRKSNSRKYVQCRSKYLYLLFLPQNHLHISNSLPACQHSYLPKTSICQSPMTTQPLIQCPPSHLLKLPSMFAIWRFWTFHNKSHNMKALIILSHSWSPFLPFTC